MITYNHVDFVAEAIDGILQQKGSFQLELVIGDDASTDGTLELCASYAARYPDVIRLLPNGANMGIMENFIRTLRSCRGQYIAICEGDDYWIDNAKVSRQLSFLEDNPDFNLCGHPVFVARKEGVTNSRMGVYQHSVFTFEDVAAINLRIPTVSLFFRNNIEFPEWVYKLYGGDRALIFLNAQKGKLKILECTSAVYRVHHGGAEQQYKKDKFALPLRNISEDTVYIKQVQSSQHQKKIRKRILKNYYYIFYWSIRKGQIRLLLQSLKNWLKFQLQY